MALDNTLICRTQASDDQICEAIAHCCDAVAMEEDGLLRYTSPGLKGTILRSTDFSKKLTHETYGFTPTREFLFRLDKFEGFQSGFNSMLCIVITLIRELVDDCVLQIGEDTPVLLRKNKNILLEISDDDQNRKAMLTKIAEGIGDPYAFGNIPEF